jgi:hypothetical protein
MTGLVNQMNEETIKRIAKEIFEFNKQVKEMQ